MKKILLASAIALISATQAYAADYSFSGNITSGNEVVSINFTLASSATNVRVWTDSFQNGINFDPITAVWSRSGSDWTRVGQNDDNASIAPGQTYWDSGLVFSSLAAGDYLFTIAQYPNFSNGTLLSQGFRYDNQTLALTRGSYYSVHLSGVDGAVDVNAAVPEPETYAMFLAGLGLMAGVARRRAQKVA